MSITTHHPEYTKFKPRWQRVSDVLDGQDTVHENGEIYLPKTSGMEKNDPLNKHYDAYKLRARLPSITRQALTGIIGIMFAEDPLGSIDDVVTNTGKTTLQLAREVTRSVINAGRSILVVESSGNGSPYIARYPATAMINWKVAEDNASKLTLAVFEESVQKGDDEYSHSTELRYRKYSLVNGRPAVQTFTEKDEPLSEPLTLAGKELPIVVIGSIDTDPCCDPIPLQPIAECALSIYRMSADVKQDMFISGQKQLWMAGVSEEEAKDATDQGYGAGSRWAFNDPQAKVGLLESSGSSYKDASAERDYELKEAASHAVQITQSNEGVESAKAIAMRSAAQHASIYTMANSISIGINKALNFRTAIYPALTRMVKGDSGQIMAVTDKAEKFVLSTDFAVSDTSDHLFNALNSAINAGNAPRSVMFEAMRKAQLTNASNEDIQKEIDRQSPVGVSG